MTNLESLRSLQKRIRESKGVDPRLDRDIAFALTDWTLSSQELPPIFTADPDGLGPCVALQRALLPGYRVDVFQHADDFQADGYYDRDGGTNTRFHKIETHARLLVIISALIAQEEAKEKADAV